MKLSEYYKMKSDVTRYCKLFGYRNTSKYMKISVESLKKFIDGEQIRPTTLNKIIDAWQTFI